MKKKENRFVLFFTDSTYRWLLFETIKIKFYSIPLINRIRIWWYTLRNYKKIQATDPWELHVEKKNMEHRAHKTKLLCALVLLQCAIRADEESEAKRNFEKHKSDVLLHPLMREPEFAELRAWFEQVTPQEADTTMIDVAIQKLTVEIKKLTSE